MAGFFFAILVELKSYRAPMATESLFSCVATSALGARTNSEAGPKGGGQDARSKRKITQREGHPAWRLPGIHARQVRELCTPVGIKPGFSTAHPCTDEKESASCRFPLRGLSSTPHRRTGARVERRASCPALGTPADWLARSRYAWRCESRKPMIRKKGF